MNNSNGSVSVNVVTQEANPSFLEKTGGWHELKKLVKDANKASTKALDALVFIMENTKDEKMKAQCAKDILQMTVQLNKEINTDQMQRLIAEIKLNRGPQGTLTQLEQDNEKNPPPVVNFGVIKVV